MSDIVGELARVKGAFDRPTLRLLHRRDAPLVLAVFRLSFPRELRAVPAERLHSQVGTYLEELAAVGAENLPADRDGRSLCVGWMKDTWLQRTVGENGAEEYSLTSHALEALHFVATLSGERVNIGESRINTILTAVHRAATAANPDRQARMADLDTQIAHLTAERDRLAGGGELTEATIDQMIDSYDDIVALIGQLPGDFRRVEESLTGMHRKIIADFRSERRPIADVIDEYLRQSDELTTATAEGRAFEGALSVLRDDGQLLQLRNDLQIILEHRFAQALKPAERRQFRDAVQVLRHGLDDVLAQRGKLSATLRDHINSHNATRDREIDRVLREISGQLTTWMESAGPRATVDVPLLPEQSDVKHLRERFYDPASDRPPEPLEDVSGQAPDGVDMAAIRQQGGPLMQQLRDALTAAIDGEDTATVADLFNSMPTDLRRPVDVLGLLHILADAMPAPHPPGEHGGSDSVVLRDSFHTIRPDGTTRTFLLPRRNLPAGGNHTAGYETSEGTSR